MPSQYVQTTARKKLQDQDKLGENESFEARLRGALSPYWTLINICANLDPNNPDPRMLNFIKDGLVNHKVVQGELIELLIESEEDREELQKLL